MATNQKPTPYNDFMNKQKLFRLNRLLSSKKVIIIIMIAIPFVLLICREYLLYLAERCTVFDERYICNGYGGK